MLYASRQPTHVDEIEGRRGKAPLLVDIVNDKAQIGRNPVRSQRRRKWCEGTCLTRQVVWARDQHRSLQLKDIDQRLDIGEFSHLPQRAAHKDTDSQWPRSLSPSQRPTLFAGDQAWFDRDVHQA